MKQKLFYKSIIIILLTINLIQVSFFLYHKNPTTTIKKSSRPDARELLNLNENQNIQFKEFAKKHRDGMTILQEKQKQLVNKYFLQPTDSLLNQIKDTEAQKIKITSQHFEDMKSSLNDYQLDNYKIFKENSIQFMLK